MGNVNVMVAARTDAAQLETIAKVDPRVKVIDVREDYRSEYWRLAGSRQLKASVPDQQRITRDLDTLLCEAEVLFTLVLLPDLLSRAPRLKWVQLSSTGVEHILDTKILQSEVTVTCARGSGSGAISEHVLMNMLMLVKQARRLLANQEHKRWERFSVGELEGKTVSLVGSGSIAQEVARRAKAFGMRVVATRRSAVAPGASLGSIDELWPLERLNDLLAEADFVVICVPVTSQTAGMIGEAQLRCMKRTASLINVSRGEVVDERALIWALKEGWIAGAGLDVFETEPLPQSSELWGLPNVIITSHLAGVSDNYGQRVVGLFCDNLRRYLAGEGLLNVVDKNTGY